MTQIAIPSAIFTNLGLFFYYLSPCQSEAISGGYTSFTVMNITDGINTVDNTYRGDYSFNFHDNKIYTVDYSRSNYNWFFVW
ncbi:hypothetical protein NIES2111_12310 [Nostoc sp. NIES-2111]|nr:hypothetical protein NIES2111_12310 [Nostoc sp. NIES-2111]